MKKEKLTPQKEYEIRGEILNLAIEIDKLELLVKEINITIKNSKNDFQSLVDYYKSIRK